MLKYSPHFSLTQMNTQVNKEISRDTEKTVSKEHNVEEESSREYELPSTTKHQMWTLYTELSRKKSYSPSGY